MMMVREKLPAEASVGSYKADLEVVYSLLGSNESTRIEKKYAETVTISVEQAEGKADSLSQKLTICSNLRGR